MSDPRIQDKAAWWFVELDCAENSDELNALWPQFKAWLEADSQHLAAYLKEEKSADVFRDLVPFLRANGTLNADPLFRVKSPPRGPLPPKRSQ